MKTNVYAILLAAGSGNRLGNKIPKQYLFIKDKPLFFYSLKTFSKLREIDYVILIVHPTWNHNIDDSIKDEDWSNKVKIAKGGNTRHESIINGLIFLKQNFNINDNDLILTHDVARPFVSPFIILNNINKLLLNKGEVISTGIVPVDTIASTQNQYIEKIYNRDKLFIEQTPQSSTYKIFDEIYFKNKWSNDDLKNYTDFCGLAKKCNKNISIVIGEKQNFKITDEIDLDFANWFVKK